MSFRPLLRAPSALRSLGSRTFATATKASKDEKPRPRILITGCLGQVGTALVRALRYEYGASNVIASDVVIPSKEFYRDGPFVYADVTQYNTLAKIAVDEGIDWIVHNSSIQSMTGEGNPKRAMEIHINGIRNILELAKNLNLRVLAPSSMAVFSPESGLENTPDMAVMKPNTIYGVSKAFQENIGRYFHQKYGVDFRCLRYPGIISTLEEGSAPAAKLYRPTTDDFPIMVFHALRDGSNEQYMCPLKPDQVLPFLYIDDCIEATTKLLTADPKKLTKRVYNVQGISFSPRMLEEQIQKQVPDFKMKYQEDPYRQTIAAEWPNSLDGSNFARDFAWSPKYDLENTVGAMLERMRITTA